MYIFLFLFTKYYYFALYACVTALDTGFSNTTVQQIQTCLTNRSRKNKRCFKFWQKSLGQIE